LKKIPYLFILSAAKVQTFDDIYAMMKKKNKENVVVYQKFVYICMLLSQITTKTL